MMAEGSDCTLPPSPADLRAFLPYAAALLQAHFDIVVLTHHYDEIVIKQDDTKKKPRTKSETFGQSVMSVAMADSEPSLEEGLAIHGPVDVVLSCGLDSAGVVRELVLRFGRVPRLLLRILALCLRFHSQLTRLKLRGARMTAAALPDLRDLLQNSHITDLCLDFVPAHDDYGVLLQGCLRLRRLSLDSCALGDEGCGPLAAALCYPAPAALTLQTLSLASNGIGLVGAASLAEMLRSNRVLRHLNLAGNRLTDAALRPILAALVEFPVQARELRSARGALMEHLRRRRAAQERWLAELVTHEREEWRLGRVGLRRVGLRGAGRESALSIRLQLLLRAELLATREVADFRHPLLPPETTWRGGWHYAGGNTMLASLNVAYNSLSHNTLVLLGTVLTRQDSARLAGSGGGGLVRVCLVGNPLPWESCAALMVTELLTRAQGRRESQGSTRQGRSKSRPLI